MGRKRSFTFADLPGDWKEIVLSRSEQGYSVTEILSELGLTHYHHSVLMAENKEYKDTYEYGRILCEAWWVSVGRENINNSRNFNTAIWAFNLKNKFGWRDAPLAPQAPQRPLNDKVKEAEQLEEFRLKKEVKGEENTVSSIN